MRSIAGAIPQAVKSLITRTEFLAVDIHIEPMRGGVPVSYLREQAGRQIGAELSRRVPLIAVESANDFRHCRHVDRFRMECAALTREELTFLLAAAYEAGRR